MPKPSVGRVVHVVPDKLLPGEPKSTHWAATVSSITEKGLSLFVMHPSVTGSYLHDVQEDQTGSKALTWHWPEREE